MCKNKKKKGGGRWNFDTELIGQEVVKPYHLHKNY